MEGQAESRLPELVPAYADQNEHDHATFLEAIASGRIAADPDA